MKVTNEKYVIVTKDFPLKFDSANGDNVDNIEGACFYHSAEDADYVLTHSFYEPDKYQAIKVYITYEF